MINKGKRLLEFGAFRVDTAQRLLFRDDQLVPLTPKAFDTLQLLIEADGRIVEKEELLKKIWPDTFVEEGSLARNISILRKVLGESPDDQKCIQTIPKRGYRFVAPVKVSSAIGAAVVVEEHTRIQAAFDIQTDSGIEGQGTAAENPRQRVLRFRRLRAIAILGLAAIAAVGVLVWKFGGRSMSRSVQSVNSPRVYTLAVLPLDNLSHDDSQDYFSDGITDALITSLAQVEALHVISRTSAMRYKKTSKSLPQIARELGVDAILEGSVQREGDRVRISAHLVKAATDTQIWAKDYELDLSHLLQLEGGVARAIAREVQIQITPEESRRLTRSRVVSAPAQDLYMQARDLEERRGETNLAQAITRYEGALALQPEFAAAYAGLARAWLERGLWGAVEFRQTEGPARMAAERALELEPDSADAHAVAALVYAFYDSAWITAEREFRRAIDLDPNSVYAHRFLGVCLEALGRFPEAIEEEQRALALDPVSATIESEYARVLFRARKFDESVRHFQRAMELDPQDFGAYTRLAEVYEQTGRFPEALALIEKGLRLRDAEPVKSPALGRAYALAGRRTDAIDILSYVTKPGSNPQWAQDIALIYFALGDRDRGIQWLTRAFEERQLLIYLKVDPRFDAVRNDARFQALVRRLGIPEDHNSTPVESLGPAPGYGRGSVTARDR